MKKNKTFKSTEAREGVRYFLPDELFNENFEEVSKAVQEKIIGQESYMPELHVITLNGGNFKEKKFERSIVVFAEFADTSEERRELMHGLGVKMSEEKSEKGWINFPFQIIFVSEMYYAERTKLPKGKRVQDIPGRKEGVMIISMSLDKRVAITNFEVIKDSKNKITGLKEIMHSPYKESENANHQPYLLEEFWRGFALGVGPNKKES